MKGAIPVLCRLTMRTLDWQFRVGSQARIEKDRASNAEDRSMQYWNKLSTGSEDPESH